MLFGHHQPASDDADKRLTHRTFYSIGRTLPAAHQPRWQRDCRSGSRDQAAQTDRLCSSPGSLLASSCQNHQHRQLEDRQGRLSQQLPVHHHTDPHPLHPALELQQHPESSQACTHQDLCTSQAQLVQTSGIGSELAIHSAEDTQRSGEQELLGPQPLQNGSAEIRTLPLEQAAAVRQGQPNFSSSITSSEAALLKDTAQGELSTAAMLDHFPPPVNVSLENWNIAALRSDPSASSSQHLQVMAF